MKEFIRITSRENSLIKLISSLQTSSKVRNEADSFVLEGLRICSDALENGIRFDKLIVSESAALKYVQMLNDFCENADICYSVPDSLFKKISDTSSPQGILSVCKKRDIKTAQIDLKGRYIALENIADPSNLGAVARTAEALGVSGIIVTDSGCDPLSPKALRASMGTLLRVPLIFTENMQKFVENCGLTSYACVVDKNAKSIKNIKFSDGCVILIGNEANGLLEETAALCNQKITIPMKGSAESLNAANAAAIAMWEMIK